MENERDDSLVDQMKAAVQKLGSSTENYGDPTLMRFLKARSMNPEKAAKQFVQWQKWRASMVPSGFIPDEEVADELDAQKTYLGGPTKDGHPLLIVQACKHYPSKDHLQFKKFVVHLLDKTIAFASANEEAGVGNEKLVAIIDLQGISYKNVDARALITGFQCLQSYYPERLSRCYLLHMPGFFVSVWKLVCQFLDKATSEKIVIVNNEDRKADFINEIGLEALPEEYGGKAKLVALQDAKLTSA